MEWCVKEYVKVVSVQSLRNKLQKSIDAERYEIGEYNYLVPRQNISQSINQSIIQPSTQH
jgi:hypothetical protein